jgi:predicted nucleotide-binding protein
MPYHVGITTRSQPLYPFWDHDLTEPALLKSFVERYDQGLPMTVTGRIIASDEILQVQIIRTQQRWSTLALRIRARRRANPVRIALPDEYYLTNYGEDVTDQFITAPPGTPVPSTDQPAAPQTRNPRKVFVVHGHNERLRESLFAFLRSIQLDPVEWLQAISATGKPAPHIGEILHAAFTDAQAVVVLFTGDDVARLQEAFWQPEQLPYETRLTPQARPNVLFEAGMAMGRCPDRTVLVELGTLRPFSDIAGLQVVKLNNSTQRRQDLAVRLQTCGCKANLTGTDWHNAGDFTVEGPTSRAARATTQRRRTTAGAGQRDPQEGEARQTRRKPEVPSVPTEWGTKVYPAYLEPMRQHGGDFRPDTKALSPTVWHVPAYSVPPIKPAPVLYGPYVNLEPGGYVAHFRLRMNRDPEHPKKGRVRCDVVWSRPGSDTVPVNGERDVRPGRRRGYEDKTMGFTVTEEMKDVLFEFRVCQDEPGIELWVDQITIARER